jgi:O-antigen/teichoic acid export membrane protein
LVQAPDGPDSFTAILRGGMQLYATRIVAQGSRLAYMVLVVRGLGPELYGVLAYVHAWGLLFLPLVNMGSQALMSRAFGHSAQAGQDVAQRLWTMRVLAVPLLCCALLFTGAAFEPAPAVRELFLLVSLALAGRGFAVWCNHVMVANRRPRDVLVMESLFRPGELAIAAVALQTGVTLTGLLVIHAVVWWLQAFAGGLWISRIAVRPAWRWRDLEALTLLRQSLAVIICAVTQAALLQAPLALARHILGNGADLGVFALALQLLHALIALPTAIGVAALPLLAGAAGEDLGRRYQALVLPVSVVATLLLAGASSLFGEALLVMLFGPEYRTAGPLLTRGLLLMVAPLAPAVLLAQAALASAAPDALRRAAFAALGGLAGGALATAVASIYRPGELALMAGAGAGALAWLVALAFICERPMGRKL